MIVIFELINLSLIHNKIYEIRDQQVILDFDLAELYEMKLNHLQKAVKQNSKRFPTDFMFQLNKEEFETLRLQTAITKNGRCMPFAFTEHGVGMLSTIFKSEKAIEVTIAV